MCGAGRGSREVSPKRPSDQSTYRGRATCKGSVKGMHRVRRGYSRRDLGIGGAPLATCSDSGPPSLCRIRLAHVSATPKRAAKPEYRNYPWDTRVAERARDDHCAAFQGAIRRIRRSYTGHSEFLASRGWRRVRPRRRSMPARPPPLVTSWDIRFRIRNGHRRTSVAARRAASRKRPNERYLALSH
jgi:hypothetical protein